ncbi:5-oxoprolinase subunit PxpA [Bacillus safensis]|uniref:LamB/YcsF family protein n=1 Tax=Bacillus safensis TaxID=561879 RepID=UPI002E2D2DF1|nr:5-oxoprolinase subunit PxpA [Bacillus safensis]MED5221738.1 5-oxoprolinase subunit PxpA [Bacillus safensis]
MYQVDINCDLGESFGQYTIGADEQILEYVTSANIACGFHAGDPTVMRKTVRMALDKGVKIGAHPGLQDLAGFGRRPMAISAEEAYDLVIYQIGALSAFLKAEGSTMQHVKPHGALYNMAAENTELSESIAKAVYDVDPNLVLFGLSGSELALAGEQIGLQVAHEVFSDRTYQTDGTLTSRREPHALIEEDERAVHQVVRMVREGRVRTVQGEDIELKADTVCIHGDGSHALQFAKTITAKLKEAGIHLKAFQ